MHQLASWWLISIRAELFILGFSFLLFYLVGFSVLRDCRALLTPQPWLSTAFDRIARFSRIGVPVRACTQVKIELYCTTYTKYLLLCYLPLTPSYRHPLLYH